MYAHVSKSVSRLLAMAILGSLPVVLAAQSTRLSSKLRKLPIQMGFLRRVQLPLPMGHCNRSPGINHYPDRCCALGVSPQRLAVTRRRSPMILSTCWRDSQRAYFFNRHLGIQAEFAEHEWGSESSTTTNPGTEGNNDGFLTLGGGIIYRFPTGNWTPFLHAVGGTAQVEGPDHNGPAWGPLVTAGGGFDYETPWLNHHFAFRVLQADYEYMHADFGDQLTPPGPPGGVASINAVPVEHGLCLPWRLLRSASSSDPVLLSQPRYGLCRRPGFGHRNGGQPRSQAERGV